MRMAGRMGVDKVTVQNLTIHAVDAERGLILVRGPSPATTVLLVVVRNAAKKVRSMSKPLRTTPGH